MSLENWLKQREIVVKFPLKPHFKLLEGQVQVRSIFQQRTFTTFPDSFEFSLSSKGSVFDNPTEPFEVREGQGGFKDPLKNDLEHKGRVRSSDHLMS